jgi:hypothetical protein
MSFSLLNFDGQGRAPGERQVALGSVDRQVAARLAAHRPPASNAPGDIKTFKFYHCFDFIIKLNLIFRILT